MNSEDRFLSGLKGTPHRAAISRDVLEVMGDRAARAFREGDSPDLNRAIVQIVKESSSPLTEHHVQRVIEFANERAYLAEFNSKASGENRYIQFPVASKEGVAAAMQEKIASAALRSHDVKTLKNLVRVSEGEAGIQKLASQEADLQDYKSPPPAKTDAITDQVLHRSDIGDVLARMSKVDQERAKCSEDFERMADFQAREHATADLRSLFESKRREALDSFGKVKEAAKFAVLDEGASPEDTLFITYQAIEDKEVAKVAMDKVGEYLRDLDLVGGRSSMSLSDQTDAFVNDRSDLYMEASRFGALTKEASLLGKAAKGSLKLVGKTAKRAAKTKNKMKKVMLGALGVDTGKQMGSAASQHIKLGLPHGL